MDRPLLVREVATRDLETLWGICDELAASMAYPSYFCSADWLRAAVANLPKSQRPVVLTVIAGNRISAVLPLETRRNALGGRDFHFLGASFYPDPVGILCSPGDRGPSVCAIRNHLAGIPGWDRLVLTSALKDEIAAWELSARPCSVAPFRRLSGNFELLLQDLSAKKRYNLRANVRRVKEAGAEMVVSTDCGSRKLLLEAFFTLHRKRISERNVSSSVDGEGVRAFHTMLVETSEKARLYGLLLGQELIAVIYGFEFCNRFFYYQVAHDPAYGTMSPGSALLFLVVQDCCDRGLSEFNLLQGDEPYKSTWANESRVLYRGIHEQATVRSRLLGAFDRAKSSVRTMLDRRVYGH